MLPTHKKTESENRSRTVIRVHLSVTVFRISLYASGKIGIRTDLTPLVFGFTPALHPLIVLYS
jgi:hypothetical protein